MKVAPSSLTLIAAALQRELFNRGVAFLSVDECQAMLRASIDSALRAGDRAIPASRHEERAQ